MRGRIIELQQHLAPVIEFLKSGKESYKTDVTIGLLNIDGEYDPLQRILDYLLLELVRLIPKYLKEDELKACPEC
jgi:hypothetical protein